MKILIWVLALIIAGTINIFLVDAGSLSIGTNLLCTIIDYALAGVIAHALCKAWDRHKQEKKQPAQTAAIEQALAKEYPSYQKEADAQDAQVPPPAALPPIAYCRKCGAKLIPDSSFCGKCGTPVIKE